MPQSAERALARPVSRAVSVRPDPFLVYLETYSENLEKMLELQKLYKSAEDNPELE